MHCLNAWGELAVQLVQSTASPPRGSGQWDFCILPPHCLVAMTVQIVPYTASGYWVLKLLESTASLPGGSAQWNSYILPPHCLGAVGTAIAAMHCLTP